MKGRIFNSFLGRSWAIIFVILFVSQTTLLSGMYLLGARPTAEFMGRVALMLIDSLDLVVRKAQPSLLNELQERLSGRGIVLQGNPLEDVEIAGEWEYPALRRARDIIRAEVPPTHQVEVITRPSRMILLTTPSYSIGVPIAMAGAVRLWGIVSLLVIVLSLPVAYLLASRLSKPLLALAEEARVIGSSPAMRITHDPRAVDEIKTMAHALEDMRMSIDSMVRQRERFLAEIAHDIRTPLTRIRISASSCAETSSSSADILEDLTEVELTLDQTIEVARLDIEADEPGTWGDLNEILIAVVEKYRRTQRTIHTQLSSLPSWYFKPMGMTRILYNLIDNGFRHGDGRVLILSEVTDGRIQLIVRSGVRDHGNGPFPPSFLGIGTSGGEGSGLGAAIVKRLASVHGIRVIQASTAECFEVRLRFDPSAIDAVKV